MFVAGATGVIGRALVPLLLRAGHVVTGTTRSPERAAGLARLGARPVVVDVYDLAALCQAVEAARPAVVVHQLTDLPDSDAPAALEAGRAANARLRIEGTHNLVVAALAAGARRIVAQSVAFLYASGPGPHGEDAPLEPPLGASARGVHALESAVLGTDGLEGVVLRYGRLYGPGTWTAVSSHPPALHVDAAAQAALLAVTKGAPGIYNIAEDDGAVSIEKARRALGFDPAFRAPTWRAAAQLA
ncbi:MAG TPA: NAD-dependent epimerase/dehydratase family protein [Polyangia bacterium]